ncbi:hypothetical protein Mnod_1975 [Methylobacterium nodulans ORS 2060]|uniref:Uncharacterized protein n=1 Tax=Methylobacterium nodulans (strain LMG 21967 / CNCM I-2342 / ORS 2060) TaxID=460265 RepID=B8IT77_METNO|nr:hypothetical protein Mnod_1975 [Methylobacterium nodulans ORS 2060]
MLLNLLPFIPTLTVAALWGIGHHLTREWEG